MTQSPSASSLAASKMVGRSWKNRDFSRDMAPFLTSGVYANYLAADEDGRARAAFGASWERLVALKRAWDPDNVFRLNQNVSPAG